MVTDQLAPFGVKILCPMSDFQLRYHERAALSHPACRDSLSKSVAENLTYLNLLKASKGDLKFYLCLISILDCL